MIQSKTIAPMCFHGGASYKWIGKRFENISNKGDVIDADVLDAWFDPSPKALQILRDNLAWSLRCSPPAVPAGVESAIAEVIGVPQPSIICGSGSSSLIFLAFPLLLSPSSRVLLLDPTYGEYAHVVSKVVRCQLDSFRLNADEDFKVDLNKLVIAVRDGNYDMVVIVNPNNPSGQLIERGALEAAINSFPSKTTVWIDEAYIEYAGKRQSVSSFAARKSNVVVCKSLSKVLAMSGLRVGYLVAKPDLIDRLRVITPPWSLSLPAQLAVTEALKDTDYYDDRYAQTRSLRRQLSIDLEASGFSVMDSVANFVFVDYSQRLPAVDELLTLCQNQRLLLRNVRSMGTTTSNHCFRVAVKDATKNRRIVEILSSITQSFA